MSPRIWDDQAARTFEGCQSLARTIREQAHELAATALVLDEPDDLQQKIDDLRTGSIAMARAAREYARTADVLVSARRKAAKIARRGITA